MSEPEHSSAYEEIASGISSLNMPPEAIPGKEDEEFLSDKDIWAKHAVEHMRAALDLLATNFVVRAPNPTPGAVICIKTKEKDISAALTIVIEALESIREAEESEGNYTFDYFKETFKEIHTHLMRALL